MKRYNKALAVLLSAVFLSGCGSVVSESVPDSSEASSAAVTEKSLVILGDSISVGYSLDDPVSERYSAYLTQKLHSRDNITWNEYNYAVSGDDSSDLIRKLNNGRALHAPSADAIVLYIGANNLLGAYTDYAIGKAEENGIDVSDPEALTDEDIEKLQAQFEDEMQDTDAVTEQIQSIIDENLIQLESDLETIYQWIRERNTTADVYILNIYNPYTADVTSEMSPEGTDFSEYAQSQIDRANAIINDLTAEHTDLIPVDIASAFAACDPVPVLGISDTEESDGDAREAYDPHPNPDGQKLIADTVWKVMESRS